MKRRSRVSWIATDLLCIVAVLCWSVVDTPDAAAFGREDPNIAIGPSFAYVSGAPAGEGWAYGIDATLVNECRLLRTVCWASVGIRGVDGKNDDFYLPYVEAGVWLGVLNAGIGYTRLAGSNAEKKDFMHAFLGVPILLSGMDASDTPGFFLEPYYRPMYGVGGNDTRMREYGILIKFTTLKFGSWSERPRRSETSHEQQ